MAAISLIRHGHVYNPDGVLYGRLPDFRLSTKGCLQAQAAANAIANKPITAIFSSPMQRARETAQHILAKLSHLSICVTEYLNEIYSPYQGKPLRQLEAMDWEFYRNIKNPYETPEDILSRIKGFFDMVRCKFIGQHVIGVTHGDIIAFSIIWAQGLPVNGESKRRLATSEGIGYPATASITTFTLSDNGDRPIYTSYLKPY